MTSLMIFSYYKTIGDLILFLSVLFFWDLLIGLLYFFTYKLSYKRTSLHLLFVNLMILGSILLFEINQLIEYKSLASLKYTLIFSWYFFIYMKLYIINRKYNKQFDNEIV
jgi:hypothetical protein